ncbi:hypothetical protein BH10CHL1_BH10CHL1_01840 [soil metagenome]
MMAVRMVQVVWPRVVNSRLYCLVFYRLAKRSRQVSSKTTPKHRCAKLYCANLQRREELFIAKYMQTEM